MGPPGTCSASTTRGTSPRHAATFGLSYSAQRYQSPATGLVVTTAVAGRPAAWPACSRVTAGASTPRLNLTTPSAPIATTTSRCRICSARSAGVRALRSCRARSWQCGASRNLVAPGAEEFLPPPADGPWLPPERTFSSLFGALRRMRAEDVRHLEIGFAHEFGREQLFAHDPRPCLPPADHRSDRDAVRLAPVV